MQNIRNQSWGETYVDECETDSLTEDKNLKLRLQQFGIFNLSHRNRTFISTWSLQTPSKAVSSN